MTGPDIDEVHLPTVTKVSMALKTEDSDIIVDSERKYEDQITSVTQPKSMR